MIRLCMYNNYTGFGHTDPDGIVLQIIEYLIFSTTFRSSIKRYSKTANYQNIFYSYLGTESEHGRIRLIYG